MSQETRDASRPGAEGLEQPGAFAQDAARQTRLPPSPAPAEAATAAGAAEPLAAAAMAAPAAQPAATRILVVDDELAGMVFAHVRESEPLIEAALGDTTGPEFEELEKLCADKMDMAPYADNPEAFAAFLRSDAAVAQVLATDWFRKDASPELRDKLANFFAKADRAAALRAEFEKAFAPDAHKLTFLPKRPSEADTLSYDFVFLDLVLVESASAVDELKSFLKALSTSAGDRPMPPLVAMSTAGGELRKYRQDFSKHAEISAAGLWILPKSDLESADFKARGLKVLYEQLMLQRAAAHRMRGFIRSWAGALDDAADAAATTLWNLDAAAAQRIHFTAVRDNDPFDGHFGDLISREYLWHLESNAAVSTAMEELDECFRAHLDSGERIKERFMSPILDPEVGRTFFSHYVWAGWPTGKAFYGAGVERAEQRFNSTLPFGSVLAAEMKEGGYCYVHVTQQCDLNSATRPKPDERSAIFAMAEIHAAPPHQLTRFENQDLVALGLTTPNGQFDLRFAAGRVLALPIPDFLKLAEQRKLAVVGRLRFDVATQFAQAAANQLTRPASFKMARDSSLRGKVFLVGKSIPQEPKPTVYEESPGKGRVVTIARGGDPPLLSFQDEDGMRLAVWIERMLIAHCAGSALDVVALANKLRLGVKIDELIAPDTRLELLYGQVKFAFKSISGMQVPEAPAVKLVIVADESSRPT